MLEAVFVIGMVAILWERRRPGWKLARIEGWAPRALVANAVQLGVVLLAGVTWDRWMQGAGVIHLGRSVGPLAGGAITYAASTLVYYAWHRARHAVPLLWRGFHQLHHSAQRIEVITSFYKHPLEQAANTVLSAIIAFALFGLTPAGASVYTLLSAVAEIVYHANVRTPRWLGWFFQRPEMHRVHHERGRHAGNYADLPLWDMMFGTYVNPPTFDRECGFAEEKERQVGAMLRFVDVHAERRRR